MQFEIFFSFLQRSLNIKLRFPSKVLTIWLHLLLRIPRTSDIFEHVIKNLFNLFNCHYKWLHASHCTGTENSAVNMDLTFYGWDIGEDRLRKRVLYARKWWKEIKQAERTTSAGQDRKGKQAATVRKDNNGKIH